MKILFLAPVYDNQSSVDAIRYLFPYIIDSNIKKEIIVSISGDAAVGYQVWSKNPQKDYEELRKILFEHVLAYIKQKVAFKQSLMDVEVLNLFSKDRTLENRSVGSLLPDIENYQLDLS